MTGNSANRPTGRHWDLLVGATWQAFHDHRITRHEAIDQFSWLCQLKEQQDAVTSEREPNLAALRAERDPR
jgi:hypothetical protein